HGIRQVLIAFDNDSAGNDAAVKLAAELPGKGIAPLRVVFPPEMDANAYLRQMAEPETAFSLLIEGAVPMQAASDVEVAALTESPLQAEAAPQLPLAAEVAALPSAPSPVPGVVWETGATGELLISLGSLRWCIRGLSGVKAGAVALKLNAQ
ncbi:toprim domain-containing protein, partial [Xenorhabdus sp. Flor]|uniref:toprim domain-containing protein n=1 Tax=Xenorhabdus cabanillasii TaxID=351673 RepID=UPI0019A80CEE